MALSDEEKARIRYHLGYLNVTAAASFHLGVPAALQTTFMIEGAWDKLLSPAEGLVRTLLCRLDQIEEQVFDGSDLADVLETGSTKVNPDRVRDLAKYYKIAQQSLANLFGVVANPFDLRDWVQAGGSTVGNVPVR
jgi:hypothetical protein